MSEKAKKKIPKEKQQIPKRRGRPAKAMPETITALQKEVKRLRMENELLRDVIKEAESRRNLCGYREGEANVQVSSQQYASVFRGIPQRILPVP